ncbi:MAG: F0F1 ATP synthase subunit delta [Candidatus Moranbacteria bacterium]|nr:F0F1 ATP synthase subunit delta [Candidatus Moranbacteria bacterium]
MRLSIRQYAQALLDLEREEIGAATRSSERFSLWLSRRGEGKKLGKIVREAERLIREQSGTAVVRITTVHPADETLRTLLRKQAESVFVGKAVETSFATDVCLIGGAKMQSEEVLYDATLATRVERLRSSLAG